MGTNLLDRISEMADQIIAIRRDLHAHPELAFNEHRTARLITDRLRSAGIEVIEGVAGTGVVGLVRGVRPGRTLLIRADIDALPIQETSLAPYRSVNAGLMHACGHDGHAAIGLALAESLASIRHSLAGAVKVAFQPAEERIAGAKPMIEQGVMKDPDVDAVLAFHLWNYLPVGKIGVRPGPVFASADEFELIVRGKGGHGALPHQGVDSIAVAAQVVTALQTIVAREVDPLHTAVLTIGTIHGGTAFNIIADEVRMQGTVRAFREEVRSSILQRIEALAGGIASAMRARAEVSTKLGCPPVTNDEAMTDLVRRAAIAVVGADNVVTPDPTTGSDDAAYFLKEAPGCYFAVGSANPEKGLDRPHHTPDFDFDEQALVIGAQVLAQAAFDYLS